MEGSPALPQMILNLSQKAAVSVGIQFDFIGVHLRICFMVLSWGNDRKVLVVSWNRLHRVCLHVFHSWRSWDLNGSGMYSDLAFLFSVNTESKDLRNTMVLWFCRHLDDWLSTQPHVEMCSSSTMAQACTEPKKQLCYVYLCFFTACYVEWLKEELVDLPFLKTCSPYQSCNVYVSVKNRTTRVGARKTAWCQQRGKGRARQMPRWNLDQPGHSASIPRVFIHFTISMHQNATTQHICNLDKN